MSKGFDFVAVAALVATLEEENAAFDAAVDKLKEAGFVVEEHRKKVTEIQKRIDKAIFELRESRVAGTPWYEETRRAEANKCIRRTPPCNKELHHLLGRDS